MAEKIEVGYKPVGGNPVEIYHKYIVYTNSAGEQFYAGSYPQNYTTAEQTANGGFGNIDVMTGEYISR